MEVNIPPIPSVNESKKKSCKNCIHEKVCSYVFVADNITKQIEAISFDRNHFNVEMSCKDYQGKPLSNIR